MSNIYIYGKYLTLKYSKMNYKGGKIRMEAFQKIKVFLKNPGRFCLIVLGSRGTGKHYAIESAFKEIQSDKSEEDCLEDLVFIEPNDIPNEEQELDVFSRSMSTILLSLKM